MKTIVVYASKYGSTETYARWIAEALHADLYAAVSYTHLPRILRTYPYAEQPGRAQSKPFEFCSDRRL